VCRTSTSVSDTAHGCVAQLGKDTTDLVDMTVRVTKDGEMTRPRWPYDVSRLRLPSTNFKLNLSFVIPHLPPSLVSSKS